MGTIRRNLRLPRDGGLLFLVAVVVLAIAAAIYPSQPSLLPSISDGPSALPEIKSVLFKAKGTDTSSFDDDAADDEIEIVIRNTGNTVIILDSVKIRGLWNMVYPNGTISPRDTTYTFNGEISGLVLTGRSNVTLNIRLDINAETEDDWVANTLYEITVTTDTGFTDTRSVVAPTNHNEIR